MRVYSWFARRGRPASYLGKICLVSFLGVHVPLLALIGYLVLASDIPWNVVLPIAIVVLLATLVGTAMTLAVLYALLAPLRLSSDALRGYLADRTVPSLPSGYADQAGRLMADVQQAIVRLDGALDAAYTARDQAVEDHRVKFGAIAKMSHELRTPLNHIIGFAEVMQNELLGPLGSDKYRGYSADISASGLSLLELLKTVLELSRVEAGSYILSPAQVDTRATAKLAVSLSRMTAEHLGITIEADIAPDVPPIAADPRAVKQMFLHALASAVSNTPPGETVHLQVRREGRGVVAEISHRLAEDQTAKIGVEAGDDQTTPAGLAMLLVRSLARLNDGVLDLVDGVQGRRLSLRLPANAVARVA